MLSTALLCSFYILCQRTRNCLPALSPSCSQHSLCPENRAQSSDNHLLINNDSNTSSHCTEGLFHNTHHCHNTQISSHYFSVKLVSNVASTSQRKVEEVSWGAKTDCERDQEISKHKLERKIITKNLKLTEECELNTTTMYHPYWYLGFQ